jgi:hypothetical protein
MLPSYRLQYKSKIVKIGKWIADKLKMQIKPVKIGDADHFCGMPGW